MSSLPLAVPTGDRRALRRAKRTATALLVTAAAVFLLTSALPDGPAVGLVRAAAEAGTVGGLADWFAVTALFRHPLGLRLPHTALVPRQKAELATALGRFVHGNFVSADVVAHQLAEARVVHRAAVQLGAPGAAHRVGRELAAALRAALDTVEQGRATAYVLALLRRDLERRSYAPVLGALLARAVEGRVQRPLVDVAVRRARQHLETHGEQLAPVVQRLLDVHWASVLVDTARLGRRLVETGAQVLREAEDDPRHPLRTGVDDVLTRLAADLRYSPRTARDLDARLRALLDDEYVQGLLDAVLADTRASLAEGDGDLAARLAELVQDAALRVAGNPALERRLQDRLLAAVRYAVEQYGDSVVALVQRTVAGWDGRDAADRIEGAVGRDLQFIRMNGTVVGALAGVALHLLAALVS